MATYNSFPPRRLHSSRSVAPSEALELLSSYLEAAATEPYLQPNALLTEGGPISTTGPNAGLILHNLKRVEAGLRGEHLGADPAFDALVEEGLPDLQVDPTGDVSAIALISTNAVNGMEQDFDDGMDWQDKTEFEREQGITVGEVGERIPAPVILEEDVDVPQIQETKGTGNKGERKRNKKEKRRKEKQASEK